MVVTYLQLLKVPSTVRWFLDPLDAPWKNHPSEYHHWFVASILLNIFDKQKNLVTCFFFHIEDDKDKNKDHLNLITALLFFFSAAPGTPAQKIGGFFN